MKDMKWPTECPALTDEYRPKTSILGKKILQTSREKNQGTYKESVIRVAYGFFTARS